MNDSQPADGAGLTSIGQLIIEAARALLPLSPPGGWVTPEDIPNEPALALAGILYALKTQGVPVGLPEMRALDEALVDLDPPAAYLLHDIIGLRNELTPAPVRPLAVPDVERRPVTKTWALQVGMSVRRGGRERQAAAEVSDLVTRAGMTRAEFDAEIDRRNALWNVSVETTSFLIGDRTVDQHGEEGVVVQTDSDAGVVAVEGTDGRVLSWRASSPRIRVLRQSDDTTEPGASG